MCISTYICMCMYLHKYVCLSAGAFEGPRVRSPGAGVAGGSEPPDMGAESLQ